MSEESRTARFLVQCPSDDTANDPNKRSKISYTREFLLSLAQELIGLPPDVHLSISRGVEDVSGLLSPTFCDSDSRCDKSVPQQSSLKVLDKLNHSLPKSIEPYWPPQRNKAPCESSGSPDSTSQAKAEGERPKDVSHEEKSYAYKVRLPKEDKRHVNNEDTDCDNSSEAFLMSPPSGNFSSLQSSSSEITEQLDAPCKPSLIQGAVKSNALQWTTIPGTAKNCSNEYLLLQDDFIINPVNLWQKSVSHMDSYQHLLSYSEEGMQLKESEACSNINEGHSDRIRDAMESQQKSISPNLKKNLFEVHEKGAKCEDLEDYVSAPIEDKKLLLSMVDKYESTVVHHEGNLSLHGVNQAKSLSMNQDSSSSDFQVLQGLDLNTFSRLEEISNCSSELNLPDEDSLIRFDEPFLKPDEQNWDVVDESLSSPEKNSIRAGICSPSSPRDMVEKLVEAILDDESSPAPQVFDPKVNHKSGLHAQQSHTFCHYQLSPGRDQQVNNNFQRKSINTTAYSSLTRHSFPSNTFPQSFHLCHDKMTRFDHVSLPMLQQINPDTTYLCSFCGSPRGVTPDLSMHQMISCTQKLNSMQGFPLGYQEQSHGSFTWPKPGSHANGHNNQAWSWHPFGGGC